MSRGRVLVVQSPLAAHSVPVLWSGQIGQDPPTMALVSPHSCQDQVHHCCSAPPLLLLSDCLLLLTACCYSPLAATHCCYFLLLLLLSLNLLLLPQAVQCIQNIDAVLSVVVPDCELSVCLASTAFVVAPTANDAIASSACTDSQLAEASRLNPVGSLLSLWVPALPR